MDGGSILITGASGFTGRHLVAAASAAGYRCVALCKSPKDQVPVEVERVVCNLLDRSALFKVVEQARPEMVVHLAAVSFVAHQNTSDIYHTNLLGTLNLLDALSRVIPDVRKILIASSANIYGRADTLPITEELIPHPVNHYGISKYAMEVAAKLYGNLPLIVVRPFNYTGVGQAEDFLIPKLVAAFRRGDESITLGNLDVARDFSDVRDMVTAYIKLLGSGQESGTFNVCSGKSTRLMDILEILTNISGHGIAVNTHPDLVRQEEIRDLYGSNSRLEAIIGEYRRFALDDTLKWMMGA